MADLGFTGLKTFKIQYVGSPFTPFHLNLTTTVAVHHGMEDWEFA